MRLAAFFAAGQRENFYHDLLASVVVFLVALPLCMGIAIASGLPPAAGLITGIVGGLVAGSLAGCPLQVSGPAAGLTVLVFDILHEFGIAMLGVIVLLAGFFQILAGVFKLGQWFRAVSPAVINGMLSGIGVLIFAGQFHVMIDAKPLGNGLANLIAVPRALWDCFQQAELGPAHLAGAIGLLTIIVLLLWTRFAPRRLKLVPPALVAVVVASSCNYWLGLDINTVTLPDSILAGLTWPTADSLAQLANGKVVMKALALAFIASAETLLSATAVDRMQSGARTRYDRELMAQGLANMICGILGVLPLTGVIVRSSANVQAGARTRASAVMHAIWLLLFVAFLPSLLRLIPTASLAALLVFTGIKLANFAVVKSLRPYGRSEVFIFWATVTVIVTTDLLTGVLVGMALTTLKLLWFISHLQLRLEVRNNRFAELYLKGAATFISLPKLAAALDNVPGACELHIHFEDLNYIDHACLDLLMNWEAQHKAQGGILVIDWGTLGLMFKARGS